MRSLLVSLCLVLAVACGKRAAVANDLKAATAATEAALARLNAAYPRLETELDPLRTSDSKRAAARIRAEVVPLFTDLAKQLEAVTIAEERYVAVSDDDEQDAVAGIRKNAAIHQRQAVGYTNVANQYLKEARLLDAGPIPEDQARALVKARVDTLELIVHGPK